MKKATISICTVVGVLVLVISTVALLKHYIPNVKITKKSKNNTVEE